MPEFIESPILGKSRIPTEDEKTEIGKLVLECPVAVFQALNVKFNEKQLCLCIDRLPNE